MNSNEQSIRQLTDKKKSTSSDGITSDRRVAPGHRVVHVIVPESIFNHAKAQAFLSEVPWAKFIAETLRRSKPIKPNLPVESRP